jgi:sugar phosphate isomerase/epimerase
MNRRRFFKNAALGAGMVLGARSADPESSDAGFIPCINQVTTGHADFRAAMEAYHRAGFRVVEISLGSVQAYAKKESLAGARRLLSDLGLKPLCADGISDVIFPRSPGRRKRMDECQRLLELTAELGIHRFLMWSAVFEPVVASDYKASLPNLHELGDLGRQFDVVIGVEFIRGAKFLGCLETASNLLRRANHPNLGVLLDTFHFYAGISKLTDFAPLRPHEIVWVHIDDVPASPPRELLQDTDRVYVGEGVMPLATILAHAAGVYRGPVSLELFQYQRLDPAEVAGRGFRGLSSLVTQVNGSLPPWRRTMGSSGEAHPAAPQPVAASDRSAPGEGAADDAIVVRR